MNMEFSAPIYKILYDCEQKGMHLPRGWILMIESDLQIACDEFMVKHNLKYPPVLKKTK